MSRPSSTDVAIGLGAVAVAAVLTVVQAQGLPELVFVAVMLGTLSYVVRLAVRAARGARLERDRAAWLGRLQPDEVALAAVREERRRMAEDIVASLRESLESIRADADAAVPPDPLPALRRIQATSQRATSELRRHLGLLRRSDEDATAAPPPSTGDRRPAQRRDLVLAGAMTVLASVESVVHGVVDGPGSWSWWSVGLTALAAATVVGRTVALPAATVACAVFYAVAAALETPVVSGFWTVGTVGVLLWTVAARVGRSRAEVAGGSLLVASVAASSWVGDRDNLGIMLVVVGVAVVGGLSVAVARRHQARAGRIAAVREERLRAAARAAVTAERSAYARDLHDVVSHAVGVVAVQAAAAQVSWPRDPEQLRRAVGVVRSVADATLEELPGLRPGEGRSRSLDDLTVLADRIRAAGTDVELDLDLVGDHPPPDVLEVVYRVVQEALTNVVRHAPHAGARVSVRCAQGRTEVTVTDHGPGPTHQAHRGFGLVGLAERVGFAGGTFESGPAPDGGFRVHAVLPALTEAAAR